MNPARRIRAALTGGQAARGTVSTFKRDETPMPRPAVFLDRDGTLIEDRNYLSDPAGVRFLPGVPEGLIRLRDAGFALVVITNQSGIGRGSMTEDDYLAVAAEVDRQLAERGIVLDGVYFCPAHPDAADPNRKPAPGMFLTAARDLHLEMARSYSIGDSLRDVLAGRSAGCRDGILVQTGKSLPNEEMRDDWRAVPDFLAAVTAILREIPNSEPEATSTDAE